MVARKVVPSITSFVCHIHSVVVCWSANNYLPCFGSALSGDDAFKEFLLLQAGTEDCRTPEELSKSQE